MLVHVLIRADEFLAIIGGPVTSSMRLEAYKLCSKLSRISIKLNCATLKITPSNNLSSAVFVLNNHS